MLFKSGRSENVNGHCLVRANVQFGTKTRIGKITLFVMRRAPRDRSQIDIISAVVAFALNVGLLNAGQQSAGPTPRPRPLRTCARLRIRARRRARSQAPLRPRPQASLQPPAQASPQPPAQAPLQPPAQAPLQAPLRSLLLRLLQHHRIIRSSPGSTLITTWMRRAATRSMPRVTATTFLR